MNIARPFRRRLLPAVFSLLFILGVSVCFAADKWEPIFDGKTFDGWVENGGAVFTIEDGAVVGKTGDRSMGWLGTTRTYGDFTLELEVNIASGNSGVQIRSRLEARDSDDKMVGDQIEVDPTPRAWSGGLYDQGRRGWLHNLSNSPAAQAAFKTNQWNKYRIECDGASIKSWVNDVPATDYLDAMDLDGLIALQLHNGTNAHVRFRNLRLADRGRHEWKPFGQNSDDWSMAVSPANTNFIRMVSKMALADFTLRLRYLATTNTGSLRIRAQGWGTDAKDGLTVDLGATKPDATLRDATGRTWPGMVAGEKVWERFHTGDWNTLTLYSHGPHVAVDVNGYRTVEITNAVGPANGRIVLEVPVGRDPGASFKEIEILEKSR